MTMQDGIRAVQQAFTGSAQPTRWPLYVRQAKQFLRTAIDGFDERKYGFASVVDLLRAAGKEGVAVQSSFFDGVAFYQITEKGLMAHADISGTKFWVNEELR